MPFYFQMGVYAGAAALAGHGILEESTDIDPQKWRQNRVQPHGGIEEGQQWQVQCQSRMLRRVERNASRYGQFGGSQIVRLDIHD